MFSLRHGAARALATLTRTPRSLTSFPSTTALRIPFTTPLLASSVRSYATDDSESRTQSAVNTISDAAAKVSAKIGEAAAAATTIVSNEKGNTQGQRREPLDAVQREAAPPSTNLYIGNLFFEVSEDTIRQEFEKYGTVTRVRIMKDDRGMSKGFGYVHFDKQESAEQALQALQGAVVEGRRMSVQYAVKKENPGRAFGNRNDSRPGNLVKPPSRTLFIGNMSYEMTDKDLNELFREVKNVLDVRVAIDRRTGQPRGFAHADFLDVESAQKAAEYLLQKEFYGRRLRIDYSGKSSRDTAAERGEAAAPQ